MMTAQSLFFAFCVVMPCESKRMFLSGSARVWGNDPESKAFAHAPFRRRSPAFAAAPVSLASGSPADDLQTAAKDASPEAYSMAERPSVGNSAVGVRSDVVAVVGVAVGPEGIVRGSAFQADQCSSVLQPQPVGSCSDGGRCSTGTSSPYSAGEAVGTTGGTGSALARR